MGPSARRGMGVIKNVKAILMEHLESVEEGTERAQDMIISNIGETLDPALIQENEDLGEMGFEEDPDFVFKDPSERKRCSATSQLSFTMIQL